MYILMKHFAKNLICLIIAYMLSTTSNRSSCTEEDIKEAFTSNNFEVKAFKFFP